MAPGFSMLPPPDHSVGTAGGLDGHGHGLQQRFTGRHWVI